MNNMFFIEARCRSTKKPFYVRCDKAAGGVWCITYGVTTTPVGAHGAVSNRMSIDLSQAEIGPQYRCPHCGNEAFAQCGKCDRYTCINELSDDFLCAYCGNVGKINGYITDVDGTGGVGQG